MPSKFVTAWKMAGGEATPSVREMGAAFDNLMPLIFAAGGAIAPAGLAIAQSIPAEDDQTTPLHIARLSPANLFPVKVVPSMVTAMQQLTTMFLSTLTPPTPPQALAAWLATDAGAIVSPSGLKLATAMSIYMSGAFLGGIGDPNDAPPPPQVGTQLPEPLDRPVDSTVLFTYETNGTDPTLAVNQVRFTSYVRPKENPVRDLQVVSWQFDDSGVNLGSATGTMLGAGGGNPLEVSGAGRSTVFQFPYTNTFQVKLTVCNSAGSITETRSVYSA